MNKLKSTFSRSNKPAQQIVTKPFSDETYPITPKAPIIPQLKLSALAQHERLQYFSWWKDLDPFNIGVLDNKSVLHFLKGCHITDDVLEKILRLFDTAIDGLKEEQFYAMLRLIGHAQNGRRITPELVHLGAPVPRFDVNTIDALIKKPQQQQPPDLPPRNDNTKWQPNSTVNHPSISPPTNDPNWWAAQQQQQQQQQQRSPNETETYLPPPRMERSNAPGPLPSMPSSAFAQHIPQQVPQFGYNGYVNPPLSPNNGVSPPQPTFPNPTDGPNIPGYMQSKRYSAMLSPSDVNFQTFSAPENAMTYGTPPSSAPQWVETNAAWQTSQGQHQEIQTAWQANDAENLRSWAPEANTYIQTTHWPSNEVPIDSAPNMLVANEQKFLHQGKAAYGHGRSRSVPHASTETPLLPELDEPLMMSKPKLGSEIDENGTVHSQSSFGRPQQRPNVMQRASMDPDSFQKLLTKIDRGESLLLTKGLDFDSGQSLNPFRRSATISHGSRRATESDEGPFADQNTPKPVSRSSRIRSDSLAMAFDEAIPDNLSFIHPNARRNKYDLSPPPIPSQLTKPVSLKYARNRKV
ncbi:hypothetical protein VKS41_001924 [Umbelopsis sp. WA50703]